MSEINVVSKTQRIVVDPFSSSVSIINAGPQGPIGATGAIGPPGPGTPSEYLRADGTIEATGPLVVPNATLDTHALNRGQAHGLFLDQAEADALFLTPAEADALFLTPAEGNAAYLAAATKYAKGQVAYAQIAANVTLGTTAADVAGLSITHTCEANRRYRVRARLNAQSNVAGDMVRYQLLTDGAQVDLCNVVCSVASQLSPPAYVEKVYNAGVTAASHIFKVTGYRITGTGTTVIIGAASNFPQFIELEDLGPV